MVIGYCAVSDPAKEIGIPLIEHVSGRSNIGMLVLNACISKATNAIKRHATPHRLPGKFTLLQRQEQPAKRRGKKE